MSIFKACDIRGVYGTELTEETAFHIGRAIGTRLQGKKTAVGGDVRLSTPSLTDALVRGLRESGANVIYLGIVPTPAFYYAKDKTGADGGVMVTASHNPPQYNGFKVIFGDEPVTEADIADIEKRILNHDYSAGSGEFETADVIEDYEAFVFGQVELSRSSRTRRETPLKVVIDAGNGCYSHIAPRVFRRAGYQVIPLFCEPDGAFPNRMPNPAIAENLDHLCRKVTESQADLGIAFDGDGDRVTFVDETGAPVSTDKSIAVMARDILEIEKGKVVYDIKCSNIVPETVLSHGGTPLVEKSGHAFIRRRLLTEKAVMGGEISGHFFFGSIGRDDGLLAAILFADLVARRQSPLSRMISALPSYAITPDLRIPFTGDQDKLLSTIKERWTDHPISTLDGIRVEFSEGWALVRKSVTEPAITFRFEVKAQEHLRTFVDEFLDCVPEIKGEVMKRLNG